MLKENVKTKLRLLVHRQTIFICKLKRNIRQLASNHNQKAISQISRKANCKGG